MGRQFKVAFFDYVLDPSKPGRSGLSDIVWDMGAELVSQGHDVHIVATYAASDYPDSRITVHNFPSPPIGYRNLAGQLWIMKRASSLIEKLQPDVLHAPEYLSIAAFSLFGIRVPMVVTVPGNIYQRLSKQDGSGFEWYYAQVLKWAAKRAARRATIIAITSEMKQWWEWTGSKPENTPLIPLGVNGSRFRYDADARAKLGLAEDKLLLLYVGRFSKEKGLTTLLKSLKRLKDRSVQAELSVVLIGAGPQWEQLQDDINSMGLSDWVELHSWVHPDELPTWYSAADAFVLPSVTEGLPRVLLEAMACGTPAICSKTGGPVDHIQPGENGFLFDIGDDEAMAKILRHCVSDPRGLRAMRVRTRHYAQGNLMWDAITSRVVTEVYQQMTPDMPTRQRTGIGNR